MEKCKAKHRQMSKNYFQSQLNLAFINIIVSIDVGANDHNTAKDLREND